MTKADDERLQGRHPEFVRMSNRPGIGYSALHELASTNMRYGLETGTDVGAALRHGSHVYPLGRYLHRSLRLMCGRDAETPEARKLELAEEVREVREAAFNASQSFSKALAEAAAPRRLRLEKRMAIFKKGKPL